MINVVLGSLLDANEKYIAHQANAISNKSAGIAKQIFQKFPHSDIYTDRQSADAPGEIIIKGDGITNRYVINMIAQYYPGMPGYPSTPSYKGFNQYDTVTIDLDSQEARQKYFYKCLLQISKIKDLDSVAFPFNIGCGLAGGDWSIYLGNLVNFEKFVSKKNVKVSIYCLMQSYYFSTFELLKNK